MQDTEATTMTSVLSKSARVALRRSRSISSFIVASFSIYKSEAGTYASGW
ncbi:MAG: hypothetical protein WKF71_00525 [Pyrinomonadaceae bacterium]